MSGAMTSVVPRRVHEKEVTEGNISELPLFVLSNKEAKPPIPTVDGKPDLSNYVREIVLGDADSKASRIIRIKANPHTGFATMFAHKVLLAIIELVRLQPSPGPRIQVTRHQIARRLGMRRPSKKDYQDISAALDALSGVRIEAIDTWYEKAKGRRSEKMVISGLITQMRLDDSEQQEIDFSGARGNPSFITLCDAIYQNLAEGYRHGVDLDYIVALRSPLAEKLYTYLAKKDSSKAMYTERLELLGPKLGIKSRKPSVIRRTLEAALKKLEEPIFPAGPDGVRRETPTRFLSNWFIRDGMLWVAFYTQDAEKRLEAEAQAARGFEAALVGKSKVEAARLRALQAECSGGPAASQR